MREETGYQISPQRLDLISRFYASPGGTSERIFLYYAEVTDDDYKPKPNQAAGTAGNAKEGESILVRHIPVSTFFAEMIDPKITIDSKVLIASMLLRERLRTIPTEQTQPAAPGAYVFEVAKRPEFKIVVRTGNMSSIKDVDAWVNSENTDMEMDRFIGTSVSAMIRYGGAAKDEQGHVIEDTIADALRKSMRSRFSANIGTVHDTTPGSLADSHNVKRLFHIAAVHGVVNRGSYSVPADIEPVTRKALAAVERRNGKWGTSKCQSALLPMFGTGECGISAELSFPEIVGGILGYIEEQRSPALKTVHVSAFKQHDADVAIAFLKRHDGLIAKT